MQAAHQEKSQAATSSVYAAVFLTGMKLVVGLMSGSLGILAEAAHSGLDLVAALVTLFAVRIASRPADRDHLYGHGKVENLSALVETVLLLLTCGWIMREAIHRLGSDKVTVDASVWTFAVMIISIVIDISRSRMLYRVAKKHNSQALEADALHFSTDIWSSAVVLFGLAGVRIGTAFPSLGFLYKADAISALIVALIVIYVSVRLGVKTVNALLDAEPSGMADKIRGIVESVDRVRNCHAVRVRSSGADVFIDVHVVMDGGLSLIEAHEITENIESKVREAIPGSDITVHPEPDDSQSGADAQSKSLVDPL